METGKILLIINGEMFSSVKYILNHTEKKSVYDGYYSSEYDIGSVKYEIIETESREEFYVVKLPKINHPRHEKNMVRYVEMLNDDHHAYLLELKNYVEMKNTWLERLIHKMSGL